MSLSPRTADPPAVLARAAPLGPFADSGATAAASNDYFGLGLMWTREAVTGNSVYAIEITYALQLTPTLVVQPDIQVIFDPANSPSSDPVFLFQLQVTLTW